MNIDGITFKTNTENNSMICYVNVFSDALKREIRSVFSDIFHGKKIVSENEQLYSYRNTLSNFIKRYEKQTENTKKGMIGELLVHLLIPKCIEKMESISVLKNKEEQSIKKGFDIVYFDQKKLWYCEVKSGGDAAEDVADAYNEILLNRAKKQIQDTSICKRSALWDSVIIDVNLTVFSSKKRIKINELLNNDHPDFINRNTDRNIILSSVLYKNLSDKIDFKKISDYQSSLCKEGCFSELIVFSIQKNTYQKIEEFLRSELSHV